MKLQRLLLPLLFLPALVSAQSLHGPRLGLSLATQSVGGLFQNTDNLLPGVALGYGAEFPMHPQFIIMPELLWLTKGAIVRNQAQLTKSRTTLHYLELPVMVKIGTDAKPGGIFLTVGPSIGYFVSGHYKTWYNGEVTQDSKYDLQGSDNRFQFSGAVGMGTDMERVSFEFRAQTSFTPFSSTLQTQNIVYQLTFAWRFPPKGTKSGSTPGPVD
ncbi:MAG: PorT family protein [Flavobacteriales bacterium]|nr:PorT family protein [Flavobacteriales bacterium]